MANDTNSFTSLLSALGNPPGYSLKKLQRGLRTEVIDTEDWAANVSKFAKMLKDLSKIPHISRTPEWHAGIDELTLAAFNQAAEIAAKDPFVRLARGMDHTARVLELRRIYRKEIGDTKYNTWLDIPKEVRDRIEKEIIERVILPDDASKALKVKQRVRVMVNEAGNTIMIPVRKGAQKRRREMEEVSYEGNRNIAGGGEERIRKRWQGPHSTQTKQGRAGGPKPIQRDNIFC